LRRIGMGAAGDDDGVACLGVTGCLHRDGADRLPAGHERLAERKVTAGQRDDAAGDRHERRAGHPDDGDDPDGACEQVDQHPGRVLGRG